MKARLRLLLLAALLCPLGAIAATLTGVVVNGNTGSPVSGATILLRDQNVQTGTNFNGQFRLDVADDSDIYMIVNADGFTSTGVDIRVGRPHVRRRSSER